MAKSGQSKSLATQGRKRLWQENALFALSAGLLFVGGVLFAGQDFETLTRSPATFILFLATLLAITISALLLRSAYSQQASKDRGQLHEVLADIIFALSVTAAIMGLSEFSFGDWPGISTALECLLYTGLVASIARLLRKQHVALPAGDVQVPAAAEPAPATQPLPEDDVLHYVESEDHYVKFVYRSRVEHKRARFSDVIAELGPAGKRVHKSFWVNCDVVKGSRRAGRRLVLVLQDGTEIPVGRSNERLVSDILAARNSGIRANSQAPRS